MRRAGPKDAARECGLAAPIGGGSGKLLGRFGFNPTPQSHKPALRWRYRGEGLTGNKIKNMHNRASDVFLP